MSEVLFNQKDLARRWKVSHRTLERWRRTGQGPKFLKLGWLVMYRRSDVEAFEAEQLRSPSARKSSAA